MALQNWQTLANSNTKISISHKFPKFNLPLSSRQNNTSKSLEDLFTKYFQTKDFMISSVT